MDVFGLFPMRADIRANPPHGFIRRAENARPGPTKE
jgi:hypothetical protein